jgi:hypothetical protein
MEKIYTIPVNEAFDDCKKDHALGCPFCRLHDRLEENELELILGASMMEPDIRIKTNELGFCDDHFKMMLTRKNRLGLALMLESHLDILREHMDLKRLEKLENSCYVCGRIDYSLTKMIENAVALWEVDPDFEPKMKAQPYFCLPHYRQFMEHAKNRMNKKKFNMFSEIVGEVTGRYFDELRNDVSWFCKKFDYRYTDEPWYNSKDAIERAIKFLKDVKL